MADPYVQEQWAAREQQREAESLVRSDDLLNEWKAIALSNISDYIIFEINPNTRVRRTFLRAPEEMPRDLWRAVRKAKVYNAGTKDERIEIELYSKETALTRLGEYQGIRDQMRATRLADQFYRLTDEEAIEQMENDLARLRDHVAAKKAFKGTRT